MAKMRKNAWRRIMTIILSLVMVVTSLPAEAFAAGDEPEEGSEYVAGEGGSEEEAEPDEARAEPSKSPLPIPAA